MVRRALSLALLVTPVLEGACSSSTTWASSEVRALFTLPASEGALAGAAFLDMPFPSDLRKDPDGTVRWTGFYNPQENATVASYLTAMKGLLDGASIVAASYLRFTGALDPSSLPASPPDSLSEASAVQLIDVDPSSPERGKRKLAEVKFRAAPPSQEGSYWLPNTLAVMPAQGYPLRPRTKYAIVVTKRARAASGAEVAPSDDLKQALGLAAPDDAKKSAREALAPVVKELDRAGIPADYIAQMTWFTTNDPIDELFRVIDFTKSSVPAPKVDPQSWKQREITDDAYVYEASYGPVPNFQAGKLPFTNFGDGGSFAFDGAKKPILQGTFDMRATFVVPRQDKCPMPAGGYPMILYAHGTGGSYRSIVNDLGGSFARQCMASMGVDQIFHGTRPGAPPLTDPNRIGEIQTLFFNFGNPLAARTNGRQSAVDVTQQARLFTVSKQTIPANVSQTGAEVSFDASKLLFAGHSQGGVNGPMFMAADDAVRGGVLSGTGADIRVALIEKTKPAPSVAGAVRLVLGLSKGEFDTELDYFHPMMNLAQTLIDPTDPYVYMRYIIQEPRPGFAPKSIYETEGIAPSGEGDNFSPPNGIEIGAVALGLPRQLPGVRAIPRAAWGGLADVTVPAQGLRGNLASGRASGVLAQFAPPGMEDGHFVLFDVPAALAQASSFCRNLADDPVGRVPPL